MQASVFCATAPRFICDVCARGAVQEFSIGGPLRELVRAAGGVHYNDSFEGLNIKMHHVGQNWYRTAEGFGVRAFTYEITLSTDSEQVIHIKDLSFKAEKT